MFFTPNVLFSLSLLKLKTERQTTYTENPPQSYETDIKIFANPGLA